MNVISIKYEWYIHKIISELPHMMISCPMTHFVTTCKIKICWVSHRSFPKFPEPKSFG